ncbi:Nucleoside-diphosphate-sugar epimerase [Rhodovulum sp. ES.010]|uniref:SDR family oxidoreductase n=1 Tax=Rhodovulum sp. ES.010 TaxID=1882821 RepID=UPI000928520C|nr:SDR family oxidoreductase [Rhodovulum sp. ES.010]SIO48728.1 Nucleoside-diphosphate-sugar epimerase [Rhodovulum sp. ES.010]
MTDTLLSIGHGYSAQALAARLCPGWRVIGTTRDAAKAAALRAAGVEPLVWPGTDLAPALDRATHLLSSVPPGPQGDPVVAELEAQLRAADHLEWVGYLSTTGVYGDHDGGWVDESTPLSPTTSRGQARVAAEAAWAALGLPLHIFRLAGIYGPGRSPLDRVRAGTARRIVKPGQVFSRIHVEDIAQVLAASMARPRPGAVYNVADDEPAPPQDVIAFAARMLGRPLPPETPFEEADLSPMARSFYAESKRVANNRIKAELGVHLRHPDYRTGLAAEVETERDARRKA